MTGSRPGRAAALLLSAVLVGCAGLRKDTAPATTILRATTATSVAPAATTTTTAAGGALATRDLLAPLAIDDRPPPGGYRRDEWPHWLDTDGDGCDARQQALSSASDVPAEVAPGCRVLTGRWVSAYDGTVTTEPARVDIDHVVPLANAHRSGGSTWSTDQRARFANDQAELWPVSASSNRSKGDSGPEEWRPPNRDAWCTYAVRWTQLKISYGLTATTPERDALGQMLDTCPPGTIAPPPPAGPAAPAPTTAPPAPPDTGTYYANCAAARAAGAAPLHEGDAGYRTGLDGDRDGVACE